MHPLLLHELHQHLGARFAEVNGMEVAADYGDALAEHGALHEQAGVLDLSFRSRVCLTRADRVRFLHGQVTKMQTACTRARAVTPRWNSGETHCCDWNLNGRKRLGL